VALPSPVLCRLSRPRGAALRLSALGPSPSPPARGDCRRRALAARTCRFYFLSARCSLNL